MWLFSTKLIKRLFSLTLICLVICSFTGCVSTSKSFGIDKDFYPEYRPVEPIPQKSVEIYREEEGIFKEVPWASLSDDEIRSLLPNQSAQVSMSKIDLLGNISYLTASVSHEAGSYDIVMDYMKYRIEDAIVNDELYGSGRIGIGLRVRASVITKKSDLNLSGLTNLGMEASLDNLSGYLSVEIIGIDSKDVTNHIPLIAKLDETSIQNAMQAIAAIKSKIWDPDVHLTPHLLAIKQEKDSSEVIIKNEIVNVSEYGFTNTSEIILRYWKPDGDNVNPMHEENLLRWMAEYDLGDQPYNIVSFIYAQDKELLRKKAIQHLKIK
jgi:hypothetical protein